MGTPPFSAWQRPHSHSMAEDVGNRFRPELTIEQLKLLSFDLRRMPDAACVADREEPFAKANDGVGEARRLERRIDAANEPPIMCCDSCGAMICVASLGLDAANRKKRLAADRHDVTAEHEGKKSRFGEPQF